MAESDLDWKKNNPQVQSVPSPRWLHWFIAGVIVLLLAFAHHTSGRLAGQVRVQLRHWMTVNVVPFGLNKEAAHLFSEISTAPPSRRVPPATVHRASWLAPVAAAPQLKKSFGWHGSGAHAEFQPNVILDVTPHSAVLAGVKGRVLTVGQTMVEFAAHGYHVEMFPLRLVALTHGQTLKPTTRLGFTAAAALTVEVTRSGYPVNPLLRALYGSAWLKR
jgi:hypothetical protein